MKIINTAANNEVVANIIGGNRLQLHEAIGLVGDLVEEGPFLCAIIDGKKYDYDDLDYATDSYVGKKQK